MKLNIEIIKNLFTLPLAAVLTCSIDGLPATSVTWTLNGTDLGSNSSTSLTSPNESAYTAVAVTSNLLPGEYKCSVISNGTMLQGAFVNTSVSLEESSRIIVEGRQYLFLKPCLLF